MKDVARLAGVSVQTVSVAVNNKSAISEETRERVLAAIEEIGYRPYTVARSLRTGATQTIALVVSDITNPFFASMANIVEDHAHAAGYSLLLYNTHSDLEREKNYIRMATQRWIDGLLFVSTKDEMYGLDTLKEANIPVVAIDRIPNNYEGPAVTLDNIKTGRLIAEHLIDLGHVHLAHISGPLDLMLSRERLDGFQSVIRERGLSPALYVEGDSSWSAESGYRAMQLLLEARPRPTAVFASNDRMAIGAMRAVIEAGLRIPEDISVAGVDDIELASYQIIPLTTIRQSLKDVATLGITILLEILEGKEPARSRVVCEPKLVVRASTGPPSSTE